MANTSNYAAATWVIREHPSAEGYRTAGALASVNRTFRFSPAPFPRRFPPAMGKLSRTLLHLLGLALLISLLSGCATTGASRATRPTVERLVMYRAIANEPPGDYWIGRRFFKEQLGFWGYIRRPGQPWHKAKLIMMNENAKFAHDREQGKIGIDDNYEYKLYGRISPIRIYEPATNNWYEEFLLQGYEIRDTNPPSIFGNNFTNIKTQNVITKPEVVNINQWQDPVTAYYTGSNPPSVGGAYTPPMMRPATPAAESAQPPMTTISPAM